MNPRGAFFAAAPGRSRELLVALAWYSQACGSDTYRLGIAVLVEESGLPKKTVYRALEELQGLGYLAFRIVSGYRSMVEIYLDPEKAPAKTRDKVPTLEPIFPHSNSPPTLGHHAQLAATPRTVDRDTTHSSTDPKSETPRTARGVGGTNGGGPTDLHKASSICSLREEQTANQEQTAAGFKVDEPQILVAREEQITAVHSAQLEPPENPQQQPPFSPVVFDPRLDPRDLPMLEALADQFIQLYPRKSANRLLILGAFRDQAAALAGKVGSEFENQGPVDAGLYLLDRARAYAAAVEGVPDARKGFLPTAANWLAQGRHDWPEWQWKDAGREHGSTNGRDGGNRAKPEAFDVQATLQRVREQWGGGESGGDHPGVPEAPEALREDAGGGAHDVVAGNPNGSHGDGAREGVRGRPTRGVLPDRREALGFRRSR